MFQFRSNRGDYFDYTSYAELTINGIVFAWEDGRALAPVFINAVQPHDDGDDYYGDGSEFYTPPLEYNDYRDIEPEGFGDDEECYTRSLAEHQRLLRGL
jgi:hypothetical protein